jgi:hypothetical protein
MEFIYTLPLWMLGLSIIGISVAYVVVSVTVVHRCGWAIDADEVGTATVLHAFVSVLYAVALALIVVNVQSEFSAVDDAALTEASKLSDLYRNLDGLEGPDRGRLQDEVARYVDLVIDKEWPANRRGEQSEETIRAVDYLGRHVIQLHPASADAQVVQQALLEDIDDVLDARRKRLFLGLAGMNGVMWLIIAAGAFITIGFAALFPMRRVGRQIVVLSLAAVMFALMILLIVAMDRPLRGELSVGPAAFLQIRSNIARLKQEK